MINGLNTLMVKFGIDKFLHFFFAAWFVAEFKVFGLNAVVIACFAIWILGYLKEKFMDDEFNTNDAMTSAMGAFMSLILYLIFYFMTQTEYLI